MNNGNWLDWGISIGNITDANTHTHNVFICGLTPITIFDLEVRYE